MRSLICAISFFSASINALTFLCMSSGVNCSCPTAILITPSRSLYSLPPTIFRTLVPTCVTTVPVLVLGISPLGPSCRPNPALFSFCRLSMWHRHRSKSIMPSLICAKMSSSPTRTAPAARASAAACESGAAMTQMRTSVFTGWGSRKRFRTTGPFLSVRRRTCSSYLEEDGLRPTSKARIYLFVVNHLAFLCCHLRRTASHPLAKIGLPSSDHIE
jgi:hypothetical protein